MALLNSNAMSTKLGVDIASSYLRLEIYIKPSGDVQVAINAYKDKAEFAAGGDMINSAIDFDLSNIELSEVASSSLNIASIHDLVKAELAERGLDAGKLASADIA